MYNVMYVLTTESTYRPISLTNSPLNITMIFSLYLNMRGSAGPTYSSLLFFGIGNGIPATITLKKLF